MADILIRGMEMPGNCRECGFAGFGGIRSELNVCMFSGESQSLLSHERMSKCPLVPLPAGHGRLGDLDALLEKGMKLSWSVQKWVQEVDIVTAPTIVPAEGGTDNG